MDHLSFGHILPWLRYTALVIFVAILFAVLLVVLLVALLVWLLTEMVSSEYDQFMEACIFRNLSMTIWIKESDLKRVVREEVETRLGITVDCSLKPVLKRLLAERRIESRFVPTDKDKEPEKEYRKCSEWDKKPRSKKRRKRKAKKEAWLPDLSPASV